MSIVSLLILLGKNAGKSEDVESENYPSDKEDEEEEVESDAPPPSKSKQVKKPPKKNAGVKRKEVDELKLPEPTPEEIALYSKRPRKSVPKIKESPAQVEAKAALEKLKSYATEQFSLDVRHVRQPRGVTCSRNRYPGHVDNLVKEIRIRGAFFPLKTIYVALGNVSIFHPLYTKWSLNIYIQ